MGISTGLTAYSIQAQSDLTCLMKTADSHWSPLECLHLLKRYLFFTCFRRDEISTFWSHEMQNKGHIYSSLQPYIKCTTIYNLVDMNTSILLVKSQPSNIKLYYRFQIWKYPHVHIQSENRQGTESMMLWRAFIKSLTQVDPQKGPILSVSLNRSTWLSCSINVINLPIYEQNMYILKFSYHYHSCLLSDKVVTPCLFLHNTENTY